MKRFARLFRQLDSSTSTLRKTDALVKYFSQANAVDAAWAAYFLAGGRPRRVVSTTVLRELACEISGVQGWLFDESYAVTGDLAEAITYVLPAPDGDSDDPLADWIEQRILPLREMTREEQAAAIARAWGQLDDEARFIYIKLIGGNFRVGVSKLTVQKALARVADIDVKLIAQRMMGYTDKKTMPTSARYLAIVSAADQGRTDPGQPYPFFLAHPLEGIPQSLGPGGDWIAGWKYDGIRAQVIRREKRSWIWTRGEELVTDRFPEVAAQASRLPDGTVLDGEILVWRDGEPNPSPFGDLQRRIGRTTLGPKILRELPVRLLAYDLLESDGVDTRPLPQHERRARLELVCEAAQVPVSPLVSDQSWEQMASSRERSRTLGVEGLMLKHRQSAYGAGRTRGDGIWWKWKVDPLTVDCVLTYAQAGHGRRANVYTDYTFAVWNRAPAGPDEARQVLEDIQVGKPADDDGLKLVTFAKAYSGLTDEEFRQVDKTIRKTTIQKFGPVRSVVPSMVFELAFEGLNYSKRHKSGIATRFPRMLRRRFDKPVWEIDTLQTLHTQIALANPAQAGPDNAAQ